MGGPFWDDWLPFFSVSEDYCPSENSFGDATGDPLGFRVYRI